MTDLKPCPFCGGEADLVEGDECAYVQCIMAKYHRGPFIDGDNNATEDAVEAWNQRPRTPQWNPDMDAAPKDGAFVDLWDAIGQTRQADMRWSKFGGWICRNPEMVVYGKPNYTHWYQPSPPE